MKRKTFLKLVGSSLASTALAACGGGDSEDTDTKASIDRARKPAPVVQLATLSEVEIANLYYMREEEKLAHDVYVALYKKWGVKVFNNIASSETAHTEAVRKIILSYGLVDYAASYPAGRFQNADLQALYDELVARGSASVVEALKVGCYIEEQDIKDIRDKMAETDEVSTINVYRNLLCGSYNHLQAFDRTLKSRGVSYQATVISQETWDAIVAGTNTCYN